MNRSAAALLFVLVAPLASAQDEGRVPYIETLEIRVHNVDVVVTDQRGRPVSGLTQNDFELLEDGLVRPISNFSAFTATPGAAKGAPAAAEPSADAGEQPAPRKFIFYIDDMAMTSSTQKSMRKQLDLMITTAMRPGDEAMILRPAEEKKLAAGFTSDREEIRRQIQAAIDQENWRSVASSQVEQQLLEAEMRSAPRAREKRLAARRWAALVRRRVQQRLGSLRSAITAAGEVQGRKVLVLITESLPIEPGREAFRAFLDPTKREPVPEQMSPFAVWIDSPADYMSVDWVDLSPMVEEIARTAATNGITIYAVQAEYGIAGFAPGSDIAAAPPGRDSWDSGVPFRRSSSAGAPTTSNYVLAEEVMTNTEASLRTLAEKTGGAFHRGAGNMDDAMQQLIRDVQSYYSLGYRAGNEIDKTHTLQVHVKGRPELKVRTRQEVIRKSPEREMTDRVVAALLEPSLTNELGVRIEVEHGPLSLDHSSRQINIHAYVPVSALTFLPEGNMYRARFTVHYAIMGDQTDFVSGMQSPQVLEVTSEKYEQVRKQPFRYTIPVQLRTRAHQVAVGVLDSISHMSGFDRASVKSPQGATTTTTAAAN